MRLPDGTAISTALDDNGRFEIDVMDRELVELSAASSKVSEMHDRLIVASAIRRINRGGNVAVLTPDRNIRDSRLVPIVCK